MELNKFDRHININIMAIPDLFNHFNSKIMIKTDKLDDVNRNKLSILIW
jgi:hypothetical protein